MKYLYCDFIDDIPKNLYREHVQVPAWGRLMELVRKI